MAKKIAVVGLGYIGLPTAIVMCNNGLDVVGVDIVQEKVDAINSGSSPITEPGLSSALGNALKSGRFRATTEMPTADAYIIAVPTPVSPNREIDNSFILAAATSLAPLLRGGELIVLESTSAPGTTEILAHHISQLRPDLSVDRDEADLDCPPVFFAYCPERVLPGNTMTELVTNDRIIGGFSPRATELAKDLYSAFCTGKLLGTDARTAEMTKLTENAFRDLNIAFANELSLICDRLGIDVWELIKLANHHPRVNVLQPGPGVGGHCIAVDPWFIVSSAPDLSPLIRTAREVNDSKPGWVVEKIKAAAVARPFGTIVLLGLSFKANIDDLRQSPAVEICAAVSEAFPNRRIVVVEPHIWELPPRLRERGNVELSQLNDAIEGAAVVALLVDHDEFLTGTTDFGDATLIDTKGVLGS